MVLGEHKFLAVNPEWWESCHVVTEGAAIQSIAVGWSLIPFGN